MVRDTISAAGRSNSAPAPRFARGATLAEVVPDLALGEAAVTAIRFAHRMNVVAEAVHYALDGDTSGLVTAWVSAYL